MFDALNQTICGRHPAQGNLIHHSDQGMQYLPIRYAERMAEASIDMSVGSVMDNYYNAPAGSVVGLFKMEVVNHLGLWKTVDQVEWETLKWVHRGNKEQLHGAIGGSTLNEMADALHQQQNELERTAYILSKKPISNTRGN